VITIQQVYELARANGQFTYELLVDPKSACQHFFNDQLSGNDLARLQRISCEMYQIYGEKLFVATFGSAPVGFSPPTPPAP
jgi:hypothetical protein